VNLYRLDPLQDPRWPALVEHHPRASIFHTPGWLQALRQTYGYQPIVFSTCPPDQALRDGIVFCDICSWLTGRRLVSLPFSDHCEPLIDADDVPQLSAAFDVMRRDGRWRYIEMRPRTINLATGPAFGSSEDFCLHLLDLRPSDDQLFSGFHRTATQQMIRRAERECLVCEEGRGDHLVQTFHSLAAQTRQRQGLPPQPVAWFRNLAAALGDAMTIHIATAGGRPIAGIVTLRHRQTMTFKYGASNAAFHRLGAMQLLLWNAIRIARAAGCEAMDFGRSAPGHSGLRIFKDRWGAKRTDLVYWRCPPSHPLPGWVARCAAHAFRRVPPPLLATVGKYLYRHVA